MTGTSKRRTDVGPERPLREYAIAAVDATLDRLGDGEGGSLFIDGVPGTGKSHLLGLTYHKAEERGFTVATSRATGIDRLAPLSSLLPAFTNSEPPILDRKAIDGIKQNRDSWTWMIDELAEHLIRASAGNSLCVLLDDVHMLDEVSMLAVRLLIPRLSSAPILWVLAGNRAENNETLQQVVDALTLEGSDHLTLDRLTPAETARLCAELTDGEPDTDLLALAELCDGNPYAIAQLVQNLELSNRLVRSGGVVSVDSEVHPRVALSPTLILLESIAPVTRQLLNIASLLARPFTADEIGQIMEVAEEDMDRAVEEALTVGALESAGDRFDFSHTVIRRAIADSMPSATQQRLHRQIAVALEAERNAPAGEVATHRVVGAASQETDVLDLVDTAVDELANVVPGAAADLLQQTLKFTESQGWPERVANAVRLLAAAGRVAEAIELGKSSLSLAGSDVDRIRISLGLWDALKYAGRSDDVSARATGLLDETELPDAVKALGLAVRAHSKLRLGEFDQAEADTIEAARLAERAGSDEALVAALTAQSVIARGRGDLKAGIMLAQRAVASADNGSIEAQRRHPRLWLARSLQQADRLAEADESFELSLRESERLGTYWAVPLWHLYYADMLLATGQIDKCQSMAEVGLSYCDQFGTRGIDPPLRLLLARVAVLRDDLTTAHNHISTTEQMEADGYVIPSADHLMTRALVNEAEGSIREAFSLVRDMGNNLPLLAITQDPTVVLLLVRLAVGAGRAPQAAPIVDSVRELARANGDVPTLQAINLTLDGLVSKRADRAAEAVEILSNPIRRPILLAMATEVQAVAEAQTGSIAKSRQLLRKASVSLADLGAVGAQRQLLERHDLDEYDLDGSTEGWDSLTNAEKRVARAVATGLTNRAAAKELFLSPHTIDSHLRHAYSKLDISSRVELTRIVLENQADESSDD